MEYGAWAPYYRRIQEQFGFPFGREERSARRLEALLPEAGRQRPLERIAERLAGRTVIIAGLAPGAGSPPLWRLPAERRAPVVVAADGAAAGCLAAHLTPEVIVTDLDGPVPSEVAANSRGSLVVVHAHGDNLAELERWVPEFSGPLAGSWAGPPRESLVNVGGFTDGDRAAFLAEHVGAERILLWGFDFEQVEEPDARRAELKRRKLRVARDLLEELGRRAACPMLRWNPDGRLVPYPGPATQ